MSFGTASVDIELDASRAEEQLRALLQQIAQSAARLVITVDTRNVVPEVEGAVDAADSTVVVTGDATELTGDVTAAVDAADTAVQVTGDAREVTGDIDAAVDAADTAVTVTGDAADVTGSINAAVQAADTHVRVDAAGQDGIEGLSNAVDGLNASIIASTRSGLQLRVILQALSTGGVAVGLFQAAQAASDLAESQSKANVVFQDGIGVVTSFAETAATSVGLSEQAALEATGTFGNLFTALGLTRGAAADLAPQVIQLGADLASFNNLGVEDTLERIRSGLVGEIEPLRSIGISFNAADVEARAFELGLQGANGELSEGAKVQARWSLIVEQSSNAAGDFARTSTGLANQQRILRAEFANAVTEAGEHLLPTLLDLVEVGREELIPAFSQFTSQVLPPLASAIVALLPALGGFSNIIVGLSPVLAAIADIIGAIPPELLVLGTTFFAATRIVGLFSSGLAALQVRIASSRIATTGLGQAIGGIGGSGGGGGFAFLAAAGLTALTFAIQSNAEAAARNRQRIQTLSDSMQQSEDVATGLAEGLRQLSGEGDRVAGSLSGTGVTIDELSAAVAAGVDPWVLLGNAIRTAIDAGDIAQGTALARLAENLRDASEQQVLAAQRTDENTAAMANAAIAASTYTTEVFGTTQTQVDYVRANAILQQSLEEETERRNEVARATIEQGLITGQFTQSQADAALASEDVAAALEELQAQTADYVGTAQLARDLLTSMQDVSGATADATRAYAEALGNLNGKQVPTNQALLEFAVAASNGAITEEQLAQAAQALGVNLADLQGFIENVSGAVNEFADTAIGTIPTVNDIIGDLGENFSAESLLGELQEVTGAILEFEQNLAQLALFPNVQRVAAENGPLVAAALAEPIREGNVEVLAELEAQLGIYDDVYGQLDEKLRTEIGPNIILNTGELAKEAAGAFGENFDPQAKAETVLAEANGKVLAALPAFATALDVFGGTGRDRFDEAFRPTVNKAIVTAAATVAGVIRSAPAAANAGKLLGGSVKSGVGTGIDGTPGVVRDAADKAAAAASGAAGTGSASGKVLGEAIMGGVAAGVSAGQSSVIKAISAALGAAVSAAEKQLGIFSPSRVFTAMGREITNGLVVGLEDGTKDVTQAVADVASAATATFNSPRTRVELASPTSTLNFLREGALNQRRDDDRSAGFNVENVNMFFDGDVTPDRAREAGNAFVDGARETTRRRRLVHSVRTG